MSKVLPVCFAVVTVLGTGLLIACIATNYWKKYTVGSSETSRGLFKRCWTFEKTTTCNDLFQDFGDLPAKFAGVVALSILAALFGVLAIIVGSCGMVLNKKLFAVIAVLQLLSVVFAASGLGLYAKYYIVGLWEAGWSYIIGWVGTVFLGFGLVIMIIMAIR